KQNWKLTMTDTNGNQSWSQTFSYASSLLSADWIEEAPYSGGVLPLADFGIVPFLAGAASSNGHLTNGLPVLGTANQHGIQMTDPWGQIANPSDTNGSNGFNECWSLTTPAGCSAPH